MARNGTSFAPGYDGRRGRRCPDGCTCGRHKNAPKGAQCLEAECSDPAKSNGRCAKHLTRIKRHGSAQVVLPTGPAPSGENAYRQAHKAVVRARGTAARQVCADCGVPATEWSYRGDSPVEEVNKNGLRFSKDPQDYDPRCASCHRIYDRRHHR